MMLVSASSVSCSLALLNDETVSLDGECRVIVTGVVSDVADNTPVTGAKITFSAYPNNTLYPLPLVTKTVYSDSKGIYSVDAIGFEEEITCKVTAEGPEDSKIEYKKMTSELLIPWKGAAYDEESCTFFVNDCNFQMKKE